MSEYEHNDSQARAEGESSHSRRRRKSRRKATITSSAKRHWVWAIPLFAIVLTSIIVWRSLPPEGEQIVVSVADAEGIKKGQTRVRYMGMDVGDIKSMKFNQGLDRVEVSLHVHKSVLPLLREKTEFWVVRPDISTNGVSGIATIVSGPYITFRPGKGKPINYFKALDKPPVLERKGTKVEVISDQLHNIAPGDDIYYKQVPVGKVYAYQLRSEDVILYGQIHAPYDKLLRDNSVFWEQSGLEMDLGFTGVSVSADPIVSLLNGGLSFATPPEYGNQAQAGAQFSLQADPDEDWQNWTPAIELPERIIDQEGETPDSADLMSSTAKNAAAEE